MKEKIECILCKTKRVLTQFYEGYDKCKVCLVVKDGIFLRGKYKGVSVDNIKHIDNNYYNWCLSNIDNFPN